MSLEGKFHIVPHFKGLINAFLAFSCQGGSSFLVLKKAEYLIIGVHESNLEIEPHLLIDSYLEYFQVESK